MIQILSLVPCFPANFWHIEKSRHKATFYTEIELLFFRNPLPYPPVNPILLFVQRAYAASAFAAGAW